ncbi:hypothetical protein BJF78_02150 [Pseudonocardia sp. CNS-139]|nr:hypothetical protein BJF78_02150 [Pseudonocardia sp. CNS-139]
MAWTGGARRPAPAADPEPAAPGRGRHAAPDDGEAVTAAIPIAELLAALDPNGATGRHRRPR